MTVEVERAENPLGIRDNAILFRGDAIANLPTQRIFKYISHCGTLPLGLEWVNDTNVVLVWSTVAETRSAYESMREAGTGHLAEDDEGFVPAKPIPETLAHVALRVEKALGKTDVQEQAQMWMRFARAEDVKQKGGRNKSKFYEKYGENAGKDGQNVYSSRRGERSRREDPDEALRRRLDAELDGFAEKDETARRSISPRRGRSASPPGRELPRDGPGRRRKRSDYEYDQDLQSRLGPRVGGATGSVREWDVGKEWHTDEFGRSRYGTMSRDGRKDARGHRRERGERGGERREGQGRPSKTKEELDAELDAFLEG